MNPKKLKGNIIVSIIIFAVLTGNLLRLHVLDSIRAVDALQLVAVGILLGVILVNAVLFMRFNGK